MPPDYPEVMESSHVRQGDIFWVDLGKPSGSAPGYRHPHVVVQNNLFNRSRIQTVVVCALTSNLKRAKAPGNVLLSKGEANLSKASVVNISQMITVDKSDLYKKIGTLSASRLQQVLEGIKFLIEPRDISNTIVPLVS
jgi:mRNA interferase MazF